MHWKLLPPEIRNISVHMYVFIFCKYGILLQLIDKLFINVYFLDNKKSWIVFSLWLCIARRERQKSKESHWWSWNKIPEKETEEEWHVWNDLFFFMRTMFLYNFAFHELYWLTVILIVSPCIVYSEVSYMMWIFFFVS